MTASTGRITFIFLLIVATLILSACGRVEISIETPEPSQVIEPGPAIVETEEPVQAPDDVLMARDVALAFLQNNYSEQVPAPGLNWAAEFTSPDSLVGAGSYQFRAKEWTITISYPIVAPEATIYTVNVFSESTGFLWEGRVDASGQVAESGDIASGQSVMGWLGYVVGSPEGAGYDDYLVLVPEGTGEFGLVGATGEIEAEITNLRDKEEPGKYANFWGTLKCEGADYNGCQLVVNRLRVGATMSDPDPIEGWQGSIYSLDPMEAQFDDYFTLYGDYPVRFGIDSAIAENGWPVYEEELAGLRDTGKTITVWGQMTCGVPDVNGCQIQVSRLKVEGVEVGPYEGWAFYTNVEYGFSFYFPPTWALREAPEEDTTAEGGPHYGRSVQLEKYGAMLYVGYRRASEDYLLGGTGMPAGEVEARGNVSFLGQELEKTVLVFEDKVKIVTYTSATVNDMTFVIRLDGTGYTDYHEVEIPDAIQWEVDKILGSFQLIPAHESWASYNASYTNSEYGFTFAYPPSWSLTDMPAVDSTAEGGFHYGRSVQLRKGATMLFIGYKWISEDHIWWTGVGAWGDAVSGGTVDFLGQSLEKTIMVYEGKVNYVGYPSVEVNDLAFGIRMDYTAYADPQSVEIPSEDLMEADQILESFTLVTDVEGAD